MRKPGGNTTHEARRAKICVPTTRTTNGTRNEIRTG